jgi:prenyltransferase beta subunit
MGERSGETAGHGNKSTFCCVTYNILFTDESRFHLDSSDGHSRVYHRVGERYADAYIIKCQLFGGGSVMVCETAGHGNKSTFCCVTYLR